MLEVPRSVRLAGWGTAVLQGRASTADAVRAVTGADEPHTVNGGEPDDVTLSDLFGELQARRIAGLRAVLPAPGDLFGLPGPPELNAAALAAGEAVLAGQFALVPAIRMFGSEWERGTMVCWQIEPATVRPPVDPTSLAEADQSLRQALSSAAEELATLDVGQWRGEAAARLAMVRDGGLPRDCLPPGTAGRVVRVVGSAARVRAIVALARGDDGGSISSWEATRRAETLRELDTVCRRAMVAAVNSLTDRTAGEVPGR